MALRAEQWAVLGFSAIGAFALYRLVTNRPRVPSPDETPILRPGEPPPGPTPTFSGPSIIGQNAPPGQALVRRGAFVYRGRLELAAPAPAAAIAAMLQAAGFGDVRVHESEPQARGAGFELGLENPTPQTRWFEARWNGQRDGAHPMPPTMVQLYPTVAARALSPSTRVPWGTQAPYALPSLPFAG